MKPSNLLRNIPSVNDLLASEPLKTLVDRVSHNVVADSVRSFLEDFREEVQRTADAATIPSLAELAERIAERVLAGETPALRPVVNATGILLHTGLGRSPLAESAVAELVAAARDYSSVELDLATGKRSQRMDAVSALLRKLTGAEAALVVNNNAGATLLALAALASGREVVVSRGQLVEIGGSYRLPDVMAASGAQLREIGTTNKTRISDYRDAINERTGALLRVHTSNYRIVGFTAEVELSDLVSLGRRTSLPVIDDIGSGALIDYSVYGLTGEPHAAASIQAGADVVLFSGDKLLGGPQAGIAVGRRELIRKMTNHPLARALRVDKLTLAALAATLRLYRDPAVARKEVPLLALLETPLENLRNRAERLAPQLAAVAEVASAEAVEETAYLGGGSVPTQAVPTWCVALTVRDRGVDEWSAALRSCEPGVVGRVARDRLLLDLRTVFPRQDAELVAAVETVGRGAREQKSG